MKRAGKMSVRHYYEGLFIIHYFDFRLPAKMQSHPFYTIIFLCLFYFYIFGSFIPLSFYVFFYFWKSCLKHGWVLRTHFDAMNWEGLLHNALTWG